MEEKRLTVALLGRDHVIRCKTEEAGTLLDLAKELNKQLSKVKERYPSFDNESIVMLHLLNLERKQKKLLGTHHATKRQLEHLIKKIDAIVEYDATDKR